jgi:hypothetical protein
MFEYLLDYRVSDCCHHLSLHSRSGDDLDDELLQRALETAVQAWADKAGVDEEIQVRLIGHVLSRRWS